MPPAGALLQSFSAGTPGRPEADLGPACLLATVPAGAQGALETWRPSRGAASCMCYCSHGSGTGRTARGPATL